MYVHWHRSVFYLTSPHKRNVLQLRRQSQHNLGLPPYSNLSLFFQPSQRLDRPQDPCFRKPMETLQVQLRSPVKPPSPCADQSSMSTSSSKSAQRKRRQCLSLIHVGSPMVMVHWLWQCRLLTLPVCWSKGRKKMPITKSQRKAFLDHYISFRVSISRKSLFSYRFLGFTSHPSRHLTYVMDPPGDISVFEGSWAQNVNLEHKSHVSTCF